MSAQCRSLVIAATAVLAAAVASAQPRPAPTLQPAGAVPAPAFSESVLEITPAVLERLARAMAAESGARKDAAAAAAEPTPAGQKTPKEFDACQQAMMRGPEYAQLMQEYGAVAQGRQKDAKAREAAGDLMTRLAALTEKTCGPDPARTAAKQNVANRLREAEARSAAAHGFTVRQFAILKERLSPVCLSDPVPPGPDGLKVKGYGTASFVYTAAEVAALRPRCDAFVKLLYPDQD